MNESLILLYTKLKPYRWLILLGAAFLMLMIILLSLSFSQSNSEQTPQPTPTIQPMTSIAPTTQSDQSFPTPQIPFDKKSLNEETTLEENPETAANFIKKETRPDGFTHYSFVSSNPARPNIIITDSANTSLFERWVTPSDEVHISVNEYIDAFGNPEEIIQGSAFYGNTANVYVYSSGGTAFIGNPSTGKIYEEQVFQPMSVAEYKQRFANQN